MNSKTLLSNNEGEVTNYKFHDAFDSVAKVRDAKPLETRKLANQVTQHQ